MTKKERFRFNKFHIDKTWRGKFSEDAMMFLAQNKEWIANKINDSVNDPKKSIIGSDWIVIVDTGSVEQDNKEKNKLFIRTVIVSDTFDWYKGFDNMFFVTEDLKRAAVQNMQSENTVLKEVANAIVKGDGAIHDSNILFPYTVETWKKA